MSKQLENLIKKIDDLQDKLYTLADHWKDKAEKSKTLKTRQRYEYIAEKFTEAGFNLDDSRNKIEGLENQF